MNFNKAIEVFLFLLLVNSCATIQQTATSKGASIGFELVNKVKPGKTTKAEIEELFGKAASTLPAQNKSGEFWYYKERTYTRASFYFQQASNILDTVSWEVFDGDPEQDLRTALGTHPKAKWEVKTADWINPHAIPDECYFQDKSLGVSVEFKRNQKKVVSIWWWDPSDPVTGTANKDEKPPQFCIGTHCSPGIRAEEWLKNSKWPPCEIPQ